MKITHIRTTPFTIPMAQALGFAQAVMTATEHVLVEIETDEGLTGIAEAPSRSFIYGESQRSIVAAIETWFAPGIIGRDPFHLDAVWAELDRVAFNHTAKGAIDLALHDIMGQALGIPCARLLGGGAESLRATYVCGAAKPEIMAEQVLAIHERYGIDAFKLKVGVDPGKDAAMLARVREASPQALLYVDGNQAFRQHEALRMLAVCADHGVAWAEEPCAVHDRAARHIVARQGGVPILGDESCTTPQEVAREIADGTIHLVSIKLARTGFRRGRDILGLCAGHSIRPMIGSQGDSGVGVVAAAQFGAAHLTPQALPGELSFHLNLAGNVLEEIPAIRGGRLMVPQSPGMGVKIDRSKLEQFRVT
ncbi:L-alanine-DL-glutamate epimerase-like enolase superfamily enzyme [Rhodoligotrophos appendicifer]|uniref:mandelate racemase/muconate lactonizing enzyme family protein n=1 Tax=Rhodoligotrophos appendicifer TaxID=987056 RepID=UPI0011861D23|nr:mandelate racemase/muconate lactonizing enzyme family protein [Rhodoligotrophos appendicifer]